VIEDAVIVILYLIVNSSAEVEDLTLFPFQVVVDPILVALQILVLQWPLVISLLNTLVAFPLGKLWLV
jgi:hypothetical protein